MSKLTYFNLKPGTRDRRVQLTIADLRQFVSEAERMELADTVQVGAKVSIRGKLIEISADSKDVTDYDPATRP
jgi:hypothetical protein